MKNIIPFILSCIFPFLAFSQEQVVFNWGLPTTIHKPEGDFFVLHFEGAVYEKEHFYLPKHISLHSGKKAVGVEIVSVSYQNCDVLEEKLIDPRFKDTLINLSLNSYQSGGEYLNKVSFLPIRINSLSGLPEKVKTISYQLVFEEQESVGKKKHTKALSGNSVLAEGSWYKFRVSNSGLYKIDYNQLRQMGINPDNIDPRTLKIYHNGGGMLPEANADFRYEDLNELPIQVIGESDGNFDNPDYILAYIESTHKTFFDATRTIFRHKTNVYDNHSYFFLTFGGDHGLRIVEQPSLSGAEATLTSFNEFSYMEKDLVNVLRSGREWYGDEFTYINPQSYTLNTPDLVPNSSLTITSCMMGMIPRVSGSFRSRINNVVLGTQNIGSATPDNYGVKGNENTSYFNINSESIGNPSSVTIQLTWDNSNNTSGIGYTNYLAINYQRQLRTNGNPLIFSSIESLNYTTTEYEISSNNSNMVVWNIENPLQPKNIAYAFGNGKIHFTDESATLKRYIACGRNNFSTPAFLGKVSNQNLHGLSGSETLLIISPNSLLSEAEHYAAFKSSIGISALAVSVEEIYNEFACGAQDVVAIRDFIKYFYDKGSQSLKYALLFGDATYDYKNILGKNQAQVPIYEAYQSLHNMNTFSSDDYFGFLDDYEGNWTENNANDHFLNIGVGRLPVKTRSEARRVVEKLIYYTESEETLGDWRNNIAFVSDDGDQLTHMRDAERLTQQVKQIDSGYNLDKLPLDAFKQETTPNGQSSRDFDKAFKHSIDKGNLIINYTGHGNARQWAAEALIHPVFINEMTNRKKLPLFVTATCEFGRYDNPDETSGAEMLLLLENGGGIGLVTTTRPVYANYNFELNRAFYNVALSPKSDLSMPTLGDIIMQTKNNSVSGVFNRNFSLLGDPSLTLAYPKKNIVITKINEQEVSSQDTIRALEIVTLEGKITDTDGSALAGYEGTLYLRVYDKESDKKTLGDEKNSQGQALMLEYKERKSVLFEGTATIKNGKFQISFAMPKDIAYHFGSGKVSMYARPATGLIDAAGHSTDIVVGGSAENVVLDDVPPEIQLFMDDESFINGSIVNASSLLIAKVKDNNGINTSGTGIGHEITAVLDGDDKNPIVLNAFYRAKLDSYQEGEVRYLFENLAPGKHTIAFKVWDTHNNSSTATITFEVAHKLDVYNYPNPFQENTTFVIDHPRSGEAFTLNIYISDTKGGEVFTITELRDDEFGETTQILNWDGTIAGKKLAAGIYFFRAILRYTSDETVLSNLGKFVVVD